MMEAGTYYVGDLCYVLGDRWEEVCDIIIRKGRIIEGEFYLPNLGKTPIHFAYFRTAYGDGIYLDQQFRWYPIDSGCIGCILAKYIPLEIRQQALGNIIDFDEPFEVDSKNGVIYFGDLKIDTDPEEVEEEID